MVLRKNAIEEDPSVLPGNAKHINRTIKVAPGSLANLASLDYQAVFHESIHAIEEEQGDTSYLWTPGDWSERNAYWIERHCSQWVTKLRQIETLARAGRIADARRVVANLRRDFAAGVPESNATYPRPDQTGMNILRTAGYNFDLEAALRDIQTRTGVTF